MFITDPTITTFFQALGRVNRWGLYKDVSKIFIVTNMDESNKSFLNNETKLQETFIKDFKNYVSNKKLTLTGLYDFYNNFENI